MVSSSPLTKDKTVPLGIVDLFCGVGGLSLGSSRAGFTVRGAIDVDPKAISAHSRNFPNTIHLSSDVASVRGRSLKRRLGLNGKNLAGIVGGPPCQGFSAIGKRDRFDARNKLFVEFFRVVSEAMPTFFWLKTSLGLCERVIGMLGNRPFPSSKESIPFCLRWNWRQMSMEPLLLGSASSSWVSPRQDGISDG